jgi:Zn-dependent alcohol dehydrogenase
VLDRGGRSGQIDWERLISRRYALHEVDAALADVEAGRVVKAVIDPRLPVVRS